MVCRNVKWCNHFENPCGSFLKKQTYSYCMILLFHYWCFLQRNKTIRPYARLWMSVFLLQLLVWKSSLPRDDNGRWYFPEGRASMSRICAPTEKACGDLLASNIERYSERALWMNSKEWCGQTPIPALLVLNFPVVRFLSLPAPCIWHFVVAIWIGFMQVYFWMFRVA